MYFFLVFFFKQKTAYEMRISDWSSDVCSSDLICGNGFKAFRIINGNAPVEIQVTDHPFENMAKRKKTQRLPDTWRQQFFAGNHIADDVPMSKHHPLGCPGSSRGIKDRKSTRLNTSH